MIVQIALVVVVGLISNPPMKVTLLSSRWVPVAKCYGVKAQLVLVVSKHTRRARRRPEMKLYCVQ